MFPSNLPRKLRLWLVSLLLLPKKPRLKSSLPASRIFSLKILKISLLWLPRKFRKLLLLSKKYILTFRKWKSSSLLRSLFSWKLLQVQGKLIKVIWWLMLILIRVLISWRSSWRVRKLKWRKWWRILIRLIIICRNLKYNQMIVIIRSNLVSYWN